MSNLPPEIWLNILQNLYKSEIKVVSLVSQYLHAVALSILFQSIELWFGRFPIKYERSHLQYEWDSSKEEDFSLRSFKILLRIRQSTEFARAISHLRVIALADHVMVFERCAHSTFSTRKNAILILHKDHIRCALEHMHNLRRFEWIGEALPKDVAGTLHMHCPEMYSFNVTQLNESAGAALSSIHGLREFRIIDCNKSGSGILPNSQPGALVLNDLFDRNRSTLRYVALNGSDVWQSDLLRLSENLTHLAVDNAGHCSGLDLFLRHANSLESLTLLDLHTLRFLPGGGTDGKDLLPRLTDLKLQLDYSTVCEPVVTHEDLVADSEVLLSFMYHHRDLRRFDFALWPVEADFNHIIDLQSVNVRAAINGAWFSNIIQAAKTLEDVKALGISFPRLFDEEMTRLVTELCSIRLLRNCTSFRLSGVDRVDFDTVIDGVLSRLDNLSFLALHNARPFEKCKRKFRLPAAEDFVYTYRSLSLQIVCLANTFFTIDRSSRRYEPFWRWPAERTRFRTEADFPSADAHWLMSYRSVSDLYDYAPNHPDEEDELDDDDDDEPMIMAW